jgi:hypothetical protein
VRRLIKAGVPEDLRQAIKQVRALWWEIVSAQAAFWVYQHQELEKQVGEMSDQPRADRLFAQERAFISQNNGIGLQNVLRERWNLLPEKVVEGVQRGYQSGVVRVK